MEDPNKPPAAAVPPPVLPKIKLSLRLSDDEWNAFRKFLFERTKEHDEETAFKEENKGIHDYVVLMMEFYEYGRQGVIPPPWQDAYDTMKKRQHNTAFQQYMEMKQKVLQDQERFEELESIDLSKLIADPIKNVITNKKRKK